MGVPPQCYLKNDELSSPDPDFGTAWVLASHRLAAPLCLAPVSLLHWGRTRSLDFPFLTKKMNDLLSSS